MMNFPIVRAGSFRLLLAALAMLLTFWSQTASGQTTSTTTKLTSSTTSPEIGKPLTLTGTVTPTAATGTVTFYDNGVSIGTAQLASGVATLTTSFSSLGTHPITASYGGNATYLPSTSTALSHTVGKRTVNVTFTSAPSPSVVNQVVTLSFSVSGFNPTGSVIFKDGTGTTLGTIQLSSGVASLNITYAHAGNSYSVSGTYLGDTNNRQSSSTTLYPTVNKGPSVTTLSLGTNPAAAGVSTSLQAAVSGANPTGSVSFREGTTVLGISQLASGSASLSLSFAVVGAHSITAVYSGDGDNLTSTSAASTQNVAKRASSVTMSSALNPVSQNDDTTLNATVVGASPSGSVVFNDGATAIGSATVVNGVATMRATFSSNGAHSLTAAYSGDINNLASTSALFSQSVVSAANGLPLPQVSAVPVVQYQYDAVGNLTKAIQAPGQTGFNFSTQRTFDLLDRLATITDPSTGVTSIGYSGLDAAASVTDPRQLVTQYQRNGFGEATQLTSPDSGVSGVTYDSAGNIKTRTDSRGVLATYTYDALNRITGLMYSQSGQSSIPIGWSYDQVGAGYSNGVGRLTSTSHPTGSSQYAYDPRGRLLSSVQRINPAAGANSAQVVSSVAYSYDSAGNVSNIVYPSGRVVSVAYLNGRPSSISLAKDGASAPATLIDQIQYLALAGPQNWRWQLAAGPVTHTREFDSAGRLIRYPLGSNARDIGYDAAGRIAAYTHFNSSTGAAQTSLNQSFTYDSMGRLTGVTLPTTSWAIGYDANGNRTGVTLNGVATTYSPSASSNRLAATANPVRSFSYDAAGNTTSDSAGYVSTYDLTGRLSTLTKLGATNTYAYDAFGQRVRKFSSAGQSTTVIFVYDNAGRLLGEYDYAGQALREYVWFDNAPIAMFVPDTIVTNPPVVYFIHSDHLGAPRVLVDKSGAERWRWLAEPFGTTAPENNPQQLGVVTFNLRFPGQYADVESGLSYNHFRDYDPSTGRYMQSDPIGLAGGINTYAYVGGNPVSYADPDGLVRQGGQTGQWWEFRDRNFQRWFHLCVKQRGDPDATRGELADAHALWVSLGKPDGKNGCGGPPPPPPAPSGDTCGEDCKKVATTVVIGGTAYIVYRCLRMVPSLFPPLWPTIPANVAIP